MLSLFRSRVPRRFLFDMLPKNSNCAEVGVWKGDFSEKILRWSNPAELTLIDPWQFNAAFPKRWYGGSRASSQSDMDSIYDGVKSRFSSVSAVKIDRAPSLLAAEKYPEGYFDWVYIDGDHSYQAVRDDLRTWSTKLKRGGYLAGDDYFWRDERGDLSVKRAFDEFAAERGLADIVIKNDQFVTRT